MSYCINLMLKNKRRIWTNYEKKLSLNLFYKSPTAYKFLRLQKVNLLAPSTIRRCIGQSKFLPGINNIFFSHVEKKFQHKSYKEKACTVCFDEMYLHKRILRVFQRL